MNTQLQWIDFASISPLCILLCGALILLIRESFQASAEKKQTGSTRSFSSPSLISCATFILAGIAAIYSPSSQHPLLASWIRFDEVARIFTVFFILTGLGVSLISCPCFDPEKQSQTKYHGEYYFLLLTTIMGLILIGSAADFLTLFIGLETLSISLYILCGYSKTQTQSHEAAIKYFLIGSFGAALLLYGIALVYGAIGTTRLSSLANGYQNVSEYQAHLLFLSGIVLITAGLGFKAAIVPFHSWAPDVYAGAPTPVTALMAVGTKVGAFAAFALIFLLFLPNFHIIWNQLVCSFAVITMIYANFVALRQTQIKPFFAYSGISNAGFLLIPIIAGTENSLQSLLFYLIVYSAATLGSFAVIMQLDSSSCGISMNDLKGLFYRSPFAAVIFALCLLTLAGIPPTAGFLAKFYIFKEAFHAGYYGLVVIGLLTTILAAFYYTRIIGIMLSEPVEEKKPIRISWAPAVVGMAALGAVALLSLYPPL